MLKLLAPAALVLSAVCAFPQATQAPATPQRYASIIYLRVPAEKQAAFIEFYKTGAGAKSVRARMKADSTLFSWSLRQLMYPGENAPESNFIIVVGLNGPPAEPNPAKRDELYKGATGMNYSQYMAAVRTMSEPGGSMLMHVHHLTDGYALAEGDYVVAARFKTGGPPANAAYSEAVRDVMFPLAADRVKEGSIKGWAWSHITFPAGDSREWDVTVTTVHKALPLAAGGGGAGNTARFAKLFPNRNQTAYAETIRAGSKQVRVDLYRVAAAIQP